MFKEKEKESWKKFYLETIDKFFRRVATISKEYRSVNGVKKKNVNEEESKISIKKQTVTIFHTQLSINVLSMIYKYTYLCVTIYTYVKISYNNKYRSIDRRTKALSLQQFP